jgi:hypothetical protein
MPLAKAWEDYPEPLVDSGSGCLRWQGPHTPRGYGTFGRRGSAHRAAWEREHGLIPEGLTVDHVAARGCIWKDCVLTAHMELVTRAENVRRSNRITAQMARTHCPENHPYTPENTYMQGTKRSCRKCRHETVRRLRAKQKGAA